ncbi:neutral zinc metallopeptidase [Actinokineospora sp. UTMC 2448]|uniref:neutral zinc metallopeptidase n=1 Tax=Actinokineospora sp. UTMC 2448 TaxID=2268449 RepID=UPI00216476CE|nr:neutral zinc metallopeptidase [Actinokineospora sp. UTMC 2448]UVS77924.1 putative metalloprotease [Actinokineospora sp. UTMC 2448]
MSDPGGWRPIAPVQVVQAGPERRNSPFALVAIFAMVLVGVLLIAVVGRASSGGFTTLVHGYATSVDAEVVPKEGQAQATLDTLARNPLMRPGSPLAQVACDLPELRTDSAGLEVYYRQAIGCLDQAWAKPLEAAGKPVRSPELTVADNPRGECGFAPDEDEAVAFYCAGDEVISMPRARLLDDAADDAGLHLAVLAHEYGHHVQALAGILGTAERRERAAEEQEELELSRRVELQANCFAGLFLAAARDRGDIDADTAEAAVAGFAYVEDSDSHGSANNQLLWAKAGYAGESTADCDTWSASPSSVA